MREIRLHGPSDLRLEERPHPGKPGPGQVLLRNKAVGICGSDLHTYHDARIGDTALKGPLCLGHEFGSVVEAVGEGAVDGNDQPLQAGTPVAVDPAQPCGHCEFCERGHPNLCQNIHFCGTYPDQGALCDFMLMPSRCCFPIAKDMDFGEASLLESLGVALHAVDLATIRVGDTAAILGAGPIGLLTLQVAKLAGAGPIFISDKFPWRLKLAEKLGGVPINCDTSDPAQVVTRATKGRGVDVAIEAAWADQSVQQAADMVRLGGRMVLVGISGNDEIKMKHSTVRRKGMTIRLSRRMKHVYRRAIDLYQRHAVDFKSLISHRFPLEKSAEAFAMNMKYEPGVVKIIIDL
ncbi:MAG TPA: alcohol dehydrogenase catalytic domain-containing protein [Tepidisphaeraceae bacterium]|nr:alcohol dehydrogenase catalytic domain-containing protein [Tepidisphaeraceae bacterium]